MLCLNLIQDNLSLNVSSKKEKHRKARLNQHKNIDGSFLLPNGPKIPKIGKTENRKQTGHRFLYYFILSM